jgi:glyoxylase-like metal-dependent hydrolase (beta-lactamase superfamily II)
MEVFVKPKINPFVYVLIVSFLFAGFISAQNKSFGGEIKIGDLKVRPLQDAQFFLPVSNLAGIDKKDAVAMLDGKDSSWTPDNAFLIKSNDKIILIDAGVGKYPGEDSGHLLDQLNKAGVKPEQVNMILITHFHFDHIGGLTTQDGKKVFTNAVVYASKAENDFWLKDTAQAPQNLRQRMAQIKTVFAPYIASNSYRTFGPDEVLGKGIKVLPAYGHTPGHTGFSFTSNGKEIWFLGDLIHFNAVQFKRPMVTMQFDSDQKAAQSVRLEYFKKAAAVNAIIACAHLPEMYRLKVKGDGFAVAPVRK